MSVFLLLVSSRRSLSIFAFILLTCVAARSASPADAIVLFDALCVGTEGELDLFKKMALANGGRKIPSEKLNADRAVAAHGGQGFILKRNGISYAVVATPNNACSVFVQNVAADDMRRMLLAHYPLTSPHSDSSGTSVATIWRVSSKSRFEGGVIMLNAAKPGFGVDNTLSIGFIPAHAARKMGIVP